jgi:transposase-like protein
VIPDSSTHLPRFTASFPIPCRYSPRACWTLGVSRSEAWSDFFPGAPPALVTPGTWLNAPPPSRAYAPPARRVPLASDRGSVGPRRTRRPGLCRLKPPPCRPSAAKRRRSRFPACAGPECGPSPASPRPAPRRRVGSTPCSQRPRRFCHADHWSRASGGVVCSLPLVNAIATCSRIRRQVVDMAINGSGIRDTARVLRSSPTTVIAILKKSRRASPRQPRVPAPSLLTRSQRFGRTRRRAR